MLYSTVTAFLGYIGDTLYGAFIGDFSFTQVPYILFFHLPLYFILFPLTPTPSPPFWFWRQGLAMQSELALILLPVSLV